MKRSLTCGFLEKKGRDAGLGWTLTQRLTPVNENAAARRFAAFFGMDYLEQLNSRALN